MVYGITYNGVDLETLTGDKFLVDMIKEHNLKDNKRNQPRFPDYELSYIKMLLKSVHKLNLVHDLAELETGEQYCIERTLSWRAGRDTETVVCNDRISVERQLADMSIEKDLSQLPIWFIGDITLRYPAIEDVHTEVSKALEELKGRIDFCDGLGLTDEEKGYAMVTVLDVFDLPEFVEKIEEL